MWLPPSTTTMFMFAAKQLNRPTGQWGSFSNSEFVPKRVTRLFAKRRSFAARAALRDGRMCAAQSRERSLSASIGQRRKSHDILRVATHRGNNGQPK
jgi:hypothetical protein